MNANGDAIHAEESNHSFIKRGNNNLTSFKPLSGLPAAAAEASPKSPTKSSLVHRAPIKVRQFKSTLSVKDQPAKENTSLKSVRFEDDGLEPSLNDSNNEENEIQGGDVSDSYEKSFEEGLSQEEEAWIPTNSSAEEKLKPKNSSDGKEIKNSSNSRSSSSNPHSEVHDFRRKIEHTSIQSLGYQTAPRRLERVRPKHLKVDLSKTNEEVENKHKDYLEELFDQYLSTKPVLKEGVHDVMNQIINFEDGFTQVCGGAMMSSSTADFLVRYLHNRMPKRQKNLFSVSFLALIIFLF